MLNQYSLDPPYHLPAAVATATGHQSRDIHRLPPSGVHRRTQSNVATYPDYSTEMQSADKSTSPYNPFIGAGPPPNRMRVYENIPYETIGSTGFPQSNCPNKSQAVAAAAATVTTNWNRKTPSPIRSPSSHHHPLVERPMTLAFENGAAAGGSNNKLRSSLKKHAAGRRGSSASATVDFTPTKPTPSDSLTSDDSSYMSARDGYSSISSTHSRVRFSPETMLDASGQEMKPPRMSRRHMSLTSAAAAASDAEQMSTS